MSDKKKDRAGVIAPPPVIYFVVFGLGYALNYLQPLVLPPHSAWTVVGWGLIGLSIMVAASCLLSMKRVGTNVDVYKPSTAIVTDGAYGFSRNPIYLSLTTLYIGVAFLISMIWPLLVLPIALLIMQSGVIKREERYLAEKFGAEYLQYKAKVRRWI